MDQSFKDSLNVIRQETQKDLEWSLDLGYYILKIIPIPDSKLLWVVASEEKVFLVDTATHEVSSEFENLGEFIFSAALHPVSNALVIGSSSGVHHLKIDGESRSILKEENWFEHLALSNDGGSLHVSKGKLLYIFEEDGDHYQLVYKDTSFKTTISGILFNVDSFLVSSYGGVRRISSSNYEESEFFEWKTSLTTISWSPDKSFIAAGTQENQIHFWPYPLEKDKDFQMGGYPSKISKMIWSKDSHKFFVNSKNDVHVWNFFDGPPIGKMPEALACGIGKIVDITFQDTILVAISDQGAIFYFSPSKSTEFFQIHSLEDDLCCVSINHVEEEVYVGSKSGFLYCF